MIKRYLPTLVAALVLGLASGAGWAFVQMAAASPPTVSATQVAPEAGGPIALPALDASEGWETRIRVQNLGSTATHAVLTVYAASAGECPADGAPTIAVLCSELIKPGTTWTWTQADLPSTASAGLIRAWSACPDNQGIPVDVPLAVEVERVHIVDIETQAVSAYTGQSRWGNPDPETGKYTYFAPWLGMGSGEMSTLSLQNMGAACTDVEIEYFAQDGCAPASKTRIPSLAPAQAMRLEADAGQLPFKGAAYVRSSQPLAVVIDRWKPSAAQFTTYAAIPAGQAAGFAPLAYRAMQGWDATIRVQNTITNADAKPDVTIYSYAGAPLTTAHLLLCAGDTDQVDLKTYDLLPTSFTGAVRMTQAVAMVQLEDTTRGQTMAYTAVTDPLAVTGGTIGIPRLIKTETATSRLAIQNFNPNPGTTRFAIELYDNERLVDVFWDVVEVDQSWLLDLKSLRYLPNNWQGSVIIRVLEGGTQFGNPALNVVVTEQHQIGPGDRSFAYEGVVIPGPIPPMPTPVPQPTATATPTATESPQPTNTPPSGTPSPTTQPSSTPTPTETPSPTQTSSPTATVPPSPTPTPVGVEVIIPASSTMTGYAVSREPEASHLGEGHIYVGMDNRAAPLIYRGMVQFDLSSLPADAKLRTASLELVGQDTYFLTPGAGGRWRAHLLDQAVDLDWTRLGYWHLDNAAIRATLSPILNDSDLGVGITNRFEFATDQLSALEERLASTRRASFRIDGVPTAPRVRHIFDWSGGDIPGPVQYPRPALRIVYALTQPTR